MRILGWVPPRLTPFKYSDTSESVEALPPQDTLPVVRMVAHNRTKCEPKISRKVLGRQYNLPGVLKQLSPPHTHTKPALEIFLKFDPKLKL